MLRPPSLPRLTAASREWRPRFAREVRRGLALGGCPPLDVARLVGGHWEGKDFWWLEVEEIWRLPLARGAMGAPGVVPALLGAGQVLILDVAAPGLLERNLPWGWISDTLVIGLEEILGKRLKLPKGRKGWEKLAQKVEAQGGNPGEVRLLEAALGDPPEGGPPPEEVARRLRRLDELLTEEFPPEAGWVVGRDGDLEEAYFLPALVVEEEDPPWGNAYWELSLDYAAGVLEAGGGWGCAGAWEVETPEEALRLGEALGLALGLLAWVEARAGLGRLPRWEEEPPAEGRRTDRKLPWIPHSPPEAAPEKAEEALLD